MLKTINLHFNFKGIRKAVEETIKHCEECQRYKIMGKNKYGESYASVYLSTKCVKLNLNTMKEHSTKEQMDSHNYQ